MLHKGFAKKELARKLIIQKQLGVCVDIIVEGKGKIIYVSICKRLCFGGVDG
jgi:hypothetical protein